MKKYIHNLILSHRVIDLFTVSVFIILLLLSSGVWAQPGTPDLTFGTGGIVTAEVNETANAVDVQVLPDGKILIAGTAGVSPEMDFITMRFLENGMIDSTFGEEGIVATSFGVNTDQAAKLLVQEDGKIITAGVYYNYDFGTPGFDFAMIRMHPDGSPDEDFGIGGKVTSSWAIWDEYCFAAALQEDGKIIAAGSSYVVFLDFTVARYTSSGALDTSFGTGGIVTASLGPGDCYVKDILVQEDGKLVMIGQCVDSTFMNNIVLFRLNTDGSIDSSFGSEGFTETDLGDHTQDIATCGLLLADGKILVGGNTSFTGDFDDMLVRYNSNGTIDSAFGTDGLLVFSSPLSYDLCNDIYLQYDGKILVTGGAFNQFVLYRLEADGSPDILFGTGGMATVEIETGSVAKALTMQADNKIVLAGYAARPDGYNDIALARFNGDAFVDAEQIENTFTIRIAPNPCSDNITVSAKPDQPGIINYRMYGATGQMVFSGNEKYSGMLFTRSFDLSALEPGIYFLHIETGSNSGSCKILKL